MNATRRRATAEERAALDSMTAKLEAYRLAATRRPGGCPVCSAWRLRPGEERIEDGHVSTCALRGRSRFLPPGRKGAERE